MSFLNDNIDKIEHKEIEDKENEINELREDRRRKYLIDDYNKKHTTKKASIFKVPNKLTFKEFKQSHQFPYRSPNKLKSLYNNFEEANLINQPTIKDIYGFTNHYNNFNVKESKEKYNLKTYSNVRYSFIGDIFFEGAQAFLLLININTRYAYGYQLGNIETFEIKNQDDNGKVYIMKYATTGKKTTDQLIKAFKKHLEKTRMNILRFDNERGIISKNFQTMIKGAKIKFIPTISKTHTSLSLIDRLCRTIRDIVFNLNAVINHQYVLDLILDYYNNTRHETLTQTLFKAYPELKRTYPNGITPKDVNNSPQLERLFVIECKKYNLKTYSNVRYSFIGDIFFEDTQAFLLLININTRYAYGYQLGNIETFDIKNQDDKGKNI